MYHSLKPPTLQIGYISPYFNSIIKAYEHVRPCPICWLANENLEILFEGNKIGDDLSFHIDNGNIVFMATDLNEPVATIEFDQQYITLEKVDFPVEGVKPKIPTRQPNRNPVVSSLDHLKRKMINRFMNFSLSASNNNIGKTNNN